MTKMRNRWFVFSFANPKYNSIFWEIAQRIIACSVNTTITEEVCHTLYYRDEYLHSHSLKEAPFPRCIAYYQKLDCFKMPKSKQTDPLDIIMIILLVILGLVATAFRFGYGSYASTAVALLFGLFYVKAPSRSFPTGEEVTKDVDMSGKICIVTGATSGIGEETARVLALRGAAQVYICARNPSKLETSMSEMIKALPPTSKAKISTLVCDLGDLESVKACAATFLKKESKLDLLVNNAGIMALPEFKPTAQGLESQVGVCHVGHFLLTKLLTPALKKAATKETPARVVSLSSSGHRYHEIATLVQNPKLETVPYDKWGAYGNAKGSNMLFASELHHRYFAKHHICAFSVMPGGIHTGLQGHVELWTKIKWVVVTPFFFKSIPQGAATTLVCATTADPATDGGAYFEDCKANTGAMTKVKEEAGGDAGEKLWEVTDKLVTDLGFK